MKNSNLLKRVEALGFPLLAAEEGQDANLTLADMVKSGDLRLWEGFPVALANSADKGLFSYKKVKYCLKRPSDKSHLASLMSLSLALYKFFNLRFSWAEEFYKFLSAKKRKEYEKFLQQLNNEDSLNVSGCQMSSQRLKSVFNNYFNLAQSRLNELLSVKDELRLEYSLSQVFSPKQKELFLKKLKREKLTKTEREYFSRAVKKKVMALADAQLHRLAQKLLD